MKYLLIAMSLITFVALIGGCGDEDEDGSGIHFGFIEEWYLVNPAALIGVLIGYFLPHTKFPHSGHILISTWASSSYLLMRVYAEINILAVIEIFVILFLL